MNLKLSHSQLETFKLCSRKYKNRYILGIKEESTGSALIFGSAIDLGLNQLLQGKPLENANKAFIDAFTYQIINNQKIYVPDSDKINYFKKDLNLDLIKEGEPEHPWYSLKNLGLMMLEAYKREAIPRIKKVHFIQKEILLESDTSDTIGGIADFGATVDDFQKVIVDNKTASKRYASNSVKFSPQLALYSYALSAFKACYIVLVKDPVKTSTKVCESCSEAFINSRLKSCDGILKDTKKRCNGAFKETIVLSIDIQIIIDNIDETITQNVLQEFTQLSYSIKMDNFESNWSACHNQFGRKCPYFDFCRNGNMQGLIKKEQL